MPTEEEVCSGFMKQEENSKELNKTVENNSTKTDATRENDSEESTCLGMGGRGVVGFL